jgi:hypothetical protein
MEKTQILEKSRILLNKIGKFIIFILLVVFGYSICEIYHYTKKKSTNIPKKASEISVAVNERGEMLIIDRSTGEYNFYQDSVGIFIFNLYANRIQSQYKNPQ